MSFQPVPNTVVAEVLTAYGLVGTIQNNLNFRYPDGYDQDAIDILANEVAQFWNEQIMPVQSSGVTLFQVHVRGLAEELDIEAFNTEFTPENGAVASAVLPASVCFVIKFTTGFVGRSARGRVYIGGLTESEVTGNLLNVDTANSLVTAFEAMAGYLTAGKQHVVVSRFHDGAPRDEGTTLNVTGYSYSDLRVDTQRRRLAHTT